LFPKIIAIFAKYPAIMALADILTDAVAVGLLPLQGCIGWHSDKL
jgi:hypothetical protein